MLLEMHPGELLAADSIDVIIQLADDEPSPVGVSKSVVLVADACTPAPDLHAPARLESVLGTLTGLEATHHNRKR